jgi:hypothetical protein
MSATSLHAHVDEYLRLRRGLGFKLERAALILPQLVAYLEAAGASTVARERPTATLGLAARDRARVRHLPADDRPRDRDSTRRRVRRPLPAPDSVPVV